MVSLALLTWLATTSLAQGGGPSFGGRPAPQGGAPAAQQAPQPAPPPDDQAAAPPPAGPGSAEAPPAEEQAPPPNRDLESGPSEMTYSADELTQPPVEDASLSATDEFARPKRKKKLAAKRTAKAASKVRARKAKVRTQLVKPPEPLKAEVPAVPLSPISPSMP